jgi:isoleucyl-tRNA synthetase
MDELGASAANLSPLEIRKRCSAYAQKFAQLQSQQFQRLGVMGEFDRPYITMDAQYEAAVLGAFARLAEQGIVYKQLKPVHWSIENRPALAAAALEHKDRQDPSIYVAFPLTAKASASSPHQPGEGEKLFLLFGRRRPGRCRRTSPSPSVPTTHLACVHAHTADGPATFILAQERLEAVMGAIQSKRGDWLKDYRVAGTLTRPAVGGRQLHLPTSADRQCPSGVAATYVTLEDGTGLVHTAPGHGLEDYGTVSRTA